MANLRKSKITPQYEWNPKLTHGLGAYVDAKTKRIVKITEVRGAIDDYLDTKTAAVRQLALDYQAGYISSTEFQTGMEKLIPEIHMASGAAAKGGWAQMDAKAQGTVAQYIKQEYGGLIEWGKDGKTKGGGLYAFLQDIEDGKVPLDGRFINRVMQYAQAGRHTYEIIRFNDAKAAGMTEARSIRHASDSCPGCISQALSGWMPIDKLIPIGARDCLRNCKCTVEYRKDGFETDLLKLSDNGVINASRAPEEVIAKFTDKTNGNLQVVLTGRQRRHYLERHPDVQPYENKLSQVLGSPDEVHKNRTNPTTANFYKQIDKSHYLRATVAIQMEPNKFNHSVITYRIAKSSEVEKNKIRRVWKKK